MTAKAALALALLEGKVLNIKNCVTLTGLTNCPREISRMIEKPFGVTISRTPREGKSRYDSPVTWVDYRLNKSEHNLPGIEKMKEYVRDEMGATLLSDKQKKSYTQLDIFLNNS